LNFDQVVRKKAFCQIVIVRNYWRPIPFHYDQLPADGNGLEKNQQDTNCEIEKEHFFSHVASSIGLTLV